MIRLKNGFFVVYHYETYKHGPRTMVPFVHVNNFSVMWGRFPVFGKFLG